MLRRGVSGLPVVDANGQLVGIVTEGDFLRRTETRTERRHSRRLEFLLGPGRLADEYVHSHGVAEIWGTIFDEREREAVRVVAENVPGIKAVKEHLVLIEPMSGIAIELPDDEPSNR